MDWQPSSEDTGDERADGRTVSKSPSGRFNSSLSPGRQAVARRLAAASRSEQERADGTTTRTPGGGGGISTSSSTRVLQPAQQILKSTLYSDFFW
jgi:hypothetical protein